MVVLQAALSLQETSQFPIFEGHLIEELFKLLFVTAAFLYFAFAFVVTRQIKVMRTTLITPFSPVVRLLGYAHFLFAFAVFVGYLLFL